VTATAVEPSVMMLAESPLPGTPADQFVGVAPTDAVAEAGPEVVGFGAGGWESGRCGGEDQAGGFSGDGSGAGRRGNG